jgi:inner membrane protein
MDVVTHALSGALLAHATAANHARPGDLTPRARITAGALAALFPDADIGLRVFDTLAYLNLHQGYTHSLLLLPLWALLLGSVFWLAFRRRYRWRACAGVAALGIAIHIAGDLITAYGTMLFAPVSTHRYALPLAFLVDPWITAIIAATLLACLLYQPRRRIAATGCAVLAAYLTWLAVLQQQAIAIGSEYARQHGWHGALSTALPQPLSPLHRLIIVSETDRYHVATVRLRAAPDIRLPWPGVLGEIARGYAPAAAIAWQILHRYGATPDESTLARDAWHQPAFAGFRDFAQFPALDHIATSDDGVCVRFADLRFALPALAPSFRFGLCRAQPDGEWRLERLRGNVFID